MMGIRAMGWAAALAAGMVCMAPAAWAVDYPGRKALSVRVADAIVTQSVDGDIEGKSGFVAAVGGNWVLNPRFVLGLDFERERHTLRLHGDGVGSVVTVAVVPTIEFHLPPSKAGRLSPYGTLGLGYNRNSHAAGNDLGLRFGVGIDFIGMDKAVVNLEAVYRRNDADLNLTGLLIMGGIRYFL